MSHETRLTEMGLTLPPAPAPVAAYVPTVQTGGLLFVSGQMAPAGFPKGQVGTDLTVEQGYEAARGCALSLLAQVRAALGSLDRVARVVKLTGWVNAPAGFTDHPEVLNGASEVLAGVFGDAGQHARAAVGAPSLPRGAAVEVEGIFEVTR